MCDATATDGNRKTPIPRYTTRFLLTKEPLSFPLQCNFKKQPTVRDFQIIQPALVEILAILEPWHPYTDALFDIHVTDTNAKTNRFQSTASFLESA